MNADKKKNPVKLTFFEIPDLRNLRIVYDFDRSMLEDRPSGWRFLRRCLPFELPAGRFESLTTGGKLVMIIVEGLAEPGFLLKEVVSCPESDRDKRRSERLCPQGEIGQCVNAYGELHNVYEHEGRRLETVIPHCLLGAGV